MLRTRDLPITGSLGLRTRQRQETKKMSEEMQTFAQQLNKHWVFPYPDSQLPKKRFYSGCFKRELTCLVTFKRSIKTYNVLLPSINKAWFTYLIIIMFLFTFCYFVSDKVLFILALLNNRYHYQYKLTESERRLIYNRFNVRAVGPTWIRCGVRVEFCEMKIYFLV